MNNINRTLVKMQAKQLIKEKVFILFIISAVAMFLTVGITTSFNSDISDAKEELGKIFNKDNSSSSNYYNYNFGSDDFFGNSEIYGYNSGSNPIENFGKDFSNEFGNITDNNSSSDKTNSIISRISGSSSIIGTILSPLLITLFGFFVAFVRKDPLEELKLGKELRHLFKVSFNGTYLKKLVLYILRSFLECLFFALLVVPGFIFHYSSYFSYQIMCEFPNLKPSEAIKLSKKIVKGNRSELFVLDLSFILWYLLAAVTCGIALVYVIPYVMTTQALYYENFRIRALQEGRINENDFLSADEIAARYAQNNTQYAAQSDGSQYYYNPCADTQPAPEQQSQAYSYNYEPQTETKQGYYSPEPQSEPQPQPEPTEYYQPESDNNN